MNPIIEMQKSIRIDIKYEKEDYQDFRKHIDPLLSNLSKQEVTDPLKKIKIEEVTAERISLDALESELEQLFDKTASLDQNNSTVELLEIEKAFKALHLKITDCKIKVLSELFKAESTNQLIPTLLEQYEMSVRNDKFRLEELEGRINKIKDLKSVTNETINARNQLLQKVNDTLLKINQIEGYLEKQHNIKLSSLFKKEYEDIQKLHLELGKAGSPEQIEKLQDSYFERLQKYEAAIFNFLVDKRNDLVINSFLEQLSKDIAALQKQIKQPVIESIPSENMEILRNLDSELPLLQTQERVGVGANELWQYNVWARLLMPNDIKEKLGMGFKNTINVFLNKKDELKTSLVDPTKTTAQKNEIQNNIVGVKRILYHTLLTRLIDVIGDKEYEYTQLLKDPEANSEKIKETQNDLEVLNKKFNSVIKKYRELPPENQTLINALLSEHTQKFLGIATFGYFTGKTNTYEEFLTKKQYANVGYSMERNVKKWLDEIKVPPNKTAYEYLQQEVMDYLEWAKKHPNRAARMASDIALTANLIGRSDKSFLDDINTQLRTIAFTYTFLAPFGGPDWEPIEEDKELNFRALADLARYAPIIFGVSAEAANQLSQGNTNPLSVAGEVLKTLFVIGTTQSAADFIPVSSARLASAVASIVQGDSFRDIIEEQSSLEMVRLGGLAQSIFLSPTSFMDQFSRSIRIWWNKVKESEGLERFWRVTLQIAVPTVAVIGAAGLLAGIALGGPVAWGLAAIAITWVGISLGVAWKSETPLSAQFPASEKVLKREKMRAHDIAREKLEKAHHAEVVNSRDTYIKNLRAAHLLPNIEFNEKSLSPEKKQISARFIEALFDEVKGQLDWGVPVSPDPVVNFNRALDINNLIDRANQLIDDAKLNMRAKDKELLAKYIVYETVQDLIAKWLPVKIEEQLIEDALRKSGEMLDTQSEEKPPVKVKKVEEALQDYIRSQLQGKFDKEVSKEAADAFGNVWRTNK